jgi:fluoride exporter
MTNYLLVGCGGFVGSIARYWLSGLTQRWWSPDGGFPIGTLSVNVLGCLVIGVLAVLSETSSLLPTHARLLLMTGLLGGFTTFSTFGLESVQLARDAQWGFVALNVVVSVAAGLAAAWLGLRLGRLI